jgi:hypothetical protein
VGRALLTAVMAGLTAGCAPLSPVVRGFADQGETTVLVRNSFVVPAEQLLLNSHDGGIMAETELRNVPGWSADHVRSLQNSGIWTAEQVVAVSATDGGLGKLATELNLSEADTARLVDRARAALAPEVRTAMERPFKSDDRGMGARRSQGF